MQALEILKKHITWKNQEIEEEENEECVHLLSSSYLTQQ